MTSMTEAEEQQLRELGNDLASALQSPWEPRCVARAFATPRASTPVLTMQGWIDLDAMRSVLLVDEIPETLEEVETAAAVFALSVEGLTAADAVDVATAMRQGVRDAFAMALRMRPESGASDGARDGLGTWLPIFSCLVTQCGVPPSEALALPVGQAYALIAGHRRNQGWIITGTPYALRDVPEEVISNQCEKVISEGAAAESEGGLR
jgi:hypothetical protein